MNTISKVTSIIADKNEIDESEITVDSDFINDLGMDSLDLVELVLELEREFNIEISDNDAEKIRTVGEAVAYIEKQMV